MKFFISDLHLGHKYLAKERGYSNVDAMNLDIIRKWNSVVNNKDTVYVLGDMWLGKRDNLIPVLNQLAGKIILVKGNHDPEYLVRIIEARSECKVSEYKEVYIDNIRVVLSHFPYEVWNKMNKGSIHLHGHMHGYPIRKISNRFDMSIEVVLRPCSEKEIKKRHESV